MDDNSMHSLYRLKEICKTRKTTKNLFELKIPEFCVASGEFVAIVGPSGCGKSTILDLLAFVSSPDKSKGGIFHFKHSPNNEEGTDILNLWHKNEERPISHLRKRYIGYVMQTGGLLPFLSLGLNIGLPCKLNGMIAYDKRIREITSALGIENQLDKKPQYLSGGERQRAAIARALIHEPVVVLADEPTAAVDTNRAKSIIREFQTLAEKNSVAIIIATHNQHLINNLANRVFTFNLNQASENGIEKTFSTLVELKGSYNEI
jgi:putative ABC transport system ATP-binding protein